MHDHLVDDGLGEERQRQRQHLDDEGGDEHLAPDGLVLEQFRHEPAEAELTVACGGRNGVGVGHCRRGVRYGDRLTREAVGEDFQRYLARRVMALGEQDLCRVRGQDQTGYLRAGIRCAGITSQEDDQRKGLPGQIARRQRARRRCKAARSEELRQQRRSIGAVLPCPAQRGRAGRRAREQCA